MSVLRRRFTGRRLICLSLFVAAPFLNGGCMLHISPHGTITGSGRILSQERIVDAFRGVQIKGFGKVHISQGSSQSLRVDADDNVIDQVRTSVEAGMLLVDMEKKVSYANVTIEIYVTVPDLERLEITGAGDITTESPIRVETLVCDIEGAGTIRLSGWADRLEARISGSGKICCFDFVARSCKAVISGMGSCEVNVTESLDAVITGMGDIIYDGNPEVTQRVTGMGSVRGK